MRICNGFREGLRRKIVQSSNQTKIEIAGLFAAPMVLTVTKEVLVLRWPAVCDTEVSVTVVDLKLEGGSAE